MNKLIITILLTVLGVANTQQTTTVYICQGSMSECYHKSKDCKGLERCSTNLKEITLKEAKELGRRPCGYCYKRR